jgi:hypothetical protein
VLGLIVTVSVAINDYRSASEWPGTLVGRANIPPFDPSKPYEVVPFDPDKFLAQTAPKDRGLTDAEVGLAPPKPGMFDDLIPAPRQFLNIDAKAFTSAMLTIAIGLGITSTACLAVFGFFSGLGWVIAGFARD